MKIYKHTTDELKQKQNLPLDIKVRMSCYRIDQAVEMFGEDGLYISFSGGKDSTVLTYIVRELCGYKNIPLVFVDVPTQFTELKEFARTFDNLVILKSKISFKEVCEKNGFPMISKQIARYIEGARRWKRENPNGNIKDATVDYKIMYGILEHKEKGIETGEYSKTYDKSRYSFMVDAPFETSAKCCHYMKKEPLKRYSKETGRIPITGQMAEESHLRTMAWLENGCNSFNSKHPMSNPLSFWTEQDILKFIKINNISICSVYGDVVYTDVDGMPYDYVLFDKDAKLKTTKCDRTGCVLCGFGACSKNDERYLNLKETHLEMYNLLNIFTNNGVTMMEAIKWMNEHGNLNIKY